MNDKQRTLGEGEATRRVRFPASVLLSKGRMTPREIEAAEREGTIEIPALGRDEVLLEFGGVVVASGRIITRMGRSAFRIGTMFGAGDKAEGGAR